MILSIACDTIFTKLSVNHIIKNIDKIPGTIIFPEPDFLEAIVPFDSDNISASNRSYESDDIFYGASLDEYTNQYMIKDSSCNVKTKILYALHTNLGIVGLLELEDMNECWKTSTMIYFGV